MTEQDSEMMRETIATGRLELFFSDQGKFLDCFHPRLNQEEIKLFESRPNQVRIENCIFKKIRESRYFPTMNGFEMKHQIIEVNYEVII